MEQLEKIAGKGKQIAKLIPIAETTSKIPTGKCVDAYRADGGQNSRWTTRGHGQRTYDRENFAATAPSLPRLKATLVNAAVNGHAVACGDCSGAFFQAPLTEHWISLEPTPDAKYPQGYVRGGAMRIPRFVSGARGTGGS